MEIRTDPAGNQNNILVVDSVIRPNRPVQVPPPPPRIRQSATYWPCVNRPHAHTRALVSQQGGGGPGQNRV